MKPQGKLLICVMIFAKIMYIVTSNTLLTSKLVYLGCYTFLVEEGYCTLFRF